MSAGTRKSGTCRMLTTMLQKRMEKGSDEPDLPLFIENIAMSGRSIHLLVIWDAWRNVSNVERSSIIMDAYARAYPKRASPAVALGLMASEALALGYLPFRISPLVRDTDRVSLTNLNATLKQAGGVQVRNGNTIDLRFATQAQATSAYRRLMAALPSPVWTIIEERSVETA